MGSVSAAQQSPPQAIYANSNGTLTVLYANGSTTGLGVSGEVIGPMTNLDGDKYLEAPFVTSSGALRVVDTTGETQELVGSGVAQTLVATGDWDGDGQAGVFYENSNGKIGLVEVGHSPTTVTGPDGNPIATNGPLGLADYDADGDEDLVFLGSSSTIKYYDGSNVGSTGFSSFGSNNGKGLGAPVDLDGDGTPRVPYVTGSNNLALLAADGTKTKLDTNYGKAVKAPVAAVNWTGDATKEILHVNKDNNNLYYATLGGSVAPVNDSSGAKIGTTAGVGISRAAEPPAPRISNYSVSNPSGRTIAVSFESNEQLADITVSITGPEDATLTEADFTESGSGPYTYSANYTVGTDGDYTVTLETAADSMGNDGASGQSEVVSIDTAGPAVTNVTLRDATDDDGVVTTNHTVRVRATVEHQNPLQSVTANASALGAGTVLLAHQSGNSYAATFTVQTSTVDGSTRVTVTATNDYGNSDTNRSDPVVVDTTAPVVDAGPNLIVAEDTAVSFDGDGSTDNTSITRYSWAFGDGATATGVTAVHTFADPGTYTVTLTVADTVNHTATDTATVTVTDVAEDSDDTRVIRVEDDDPVAETHETDTKVITRKSGTDSARNPMWVNVTTRSPIVLGQVGNANPGWGVSMDLPTRNRTGNATNASVRFTELEFVPQRRGDFRMTLQPRNQSPDPVPNLTAANDAVEPMGYTVISHTISNENVSDVGVTFTVSSEALGARSPESITLYRYHNGSWSALDTQYLGTTGDRYRYYALSPGLSVFAVGSREAQVSVVNTSLTEEQVGVDDPAAVTAVVENTGATEGTVTVTLSTNETVIAERTVTVTAGERQRITFLPRFAEAGTYRLQVENTTVGTLTVQGKQNWSVVLVFLAAIVIAGLSGGGYLRYRDQF